MWCDESTKKVKYLRFEIMKIFSVLIFIFCSVFIVGQKQKSNYSKNPIAELNDLHLLKEKLINIINLYHLDKELKIIRLIKLQK